MLFPMPRLPPERHSSCRPIFFGVRLEFDGYARRCGKTCFPQILSHRGQMHKPHFPVLLSLPLGFSSACV